MQQTARTEITRGLANYVAGLGSDDLPPEVVARLEELFLDRAASAPAGKGQRPAKGRSKTKPAASPHTPARPRMRKSSP